VINGPLKDLFDRTSIKLGKKLSFFDDFGFQEAICMFGTAFDQAEIHVKSLCSKTVKPWFIDSIKQ
jgi:hypothetical protein